MLTSTDCRLCGDTLHHVVADLGMSPLSNAYVRPEDLLAPERFYPLTAYVCGNCFLVQLPMVESPERIFSDYAYFSSYSDTFLKHAERFCATAVERLDLRAESQVVEIASNDGYLLQYFKAAGTSVLGIEPANNVARVAEAKGIPTLVRFFGRETAEDLKRTGKQADLLVGNNVLAHVPDLKDFVAGMKVLLAPDGVISVEFPHLMRLLEDNQFDTIYHEHFSYLSLISADALFSAHGLTVFDVEELPTHGGSLRLYARHAEKHGTVDPRVHDLREREVAFGLDQLTTYTRFSEQVWETKRALLVFLIQERRSGRGIVGYGAPAKGNTLLNYCGIRQDLLDYTVDRSPHKQGLFLPGTRLPIYAPERIWETRPSYVLILPWNLEEEIVQVMGHIRDWGGRFVVPIPSVRVV